MKIYTSDGLELADFQQVIQKGNIVQGFAHHSIQFQSMAMTRNIYLCFLVQDQASKPVRLRVTYLMRVQGVALSSVIVEILE